MDLNAVSHVPKYAQIADIFRQRIARGISQRAWNCTANESVATEFGSIARDDPAGR